MSAAACAGPFDPAAVDAPAVDAAPVEPRVDAAVDAPVDAEPSSPRPILHYRFDGDGGNAGALGPAYPGLASATRWVPGRRGQAIQFAGTTASVFAIAGTANLLSARPALTIGLWVREQALPPGPIVHYLINNRCCSGATDRGVHTYHGLAGEPLTTCSVGGCATIAYTAGGWHHLLFRYAAAAGARLEIFLDGAPAGAIANPSAVPILGPGIGDLELGFNSLATIDDLVVYDQRFSDEQQCVLVVGGTWTGTCEVP